MLTRAPQDPEELRSLLADDVEMNVGEAQVLGDGGTYRGPDGVMRFFREWVGVFDDWGYEIREIVDADDWVMAELTQWGTGKASGARVEQHWWQVWTLRDGKIVRGTNHQTREDALAAVASGA